MLKLRYKRVIGCTTQLVIDFPIVSLEVFNRSATSDPLKISFQSGDPEDSTFEIDSNERFKEVVPFNSITNGDIVVGHETDPQLFDYAYWY